MKTIAINGSPRRDKNTAKILKAALRGASDAGTDIELIHLYDLNYKGCISCFQCKKKGSIPCHCYLMDELSPVLEKVLSADILLLGSPIYFQNVTSQMRAFLERLGFITLSYDNIEQRLFQGHISSAFFYTMNIPSDLSDAYDYQSIFKNSYRPLRRLGGSFEYYPVYDTWQFDDYLDYHAAGINVSRKKAVLKEQFPKDLDAAYKIGQKLALKVAMTKNN